MFTVVLVLVYKGVVSYIFPFWKLKYPNFKFPRANGTMFFEDSYDIILWKILLEKFLATCCHAYVKRRTRLGEVLFFPLDCYTCFLVTRGLCLQMFNGFWCHTPMLNVRLGACFLSYYIEWVFDLWNLERRKIPLKKRQLCLGVFFFFGGGVGDDGGILWSERVWLTN